MSHYARWLIGAAFIAGVVPACLDKKLGSHGAGVGDADASPADTFVADSAVAPDSGKPDDVRPDANACKPTIEIAETGFVRFDDFGMSFSPVVLDDTRIYGTRRETRDDGSFRRYIVAVDVATGTEEALPEDGTEQLVMDGRDGAIVYLSMQPSWSMNGLYYRDMRTGDVVELAAAKEGRHLTLSPGAYAWDQGRRIVERGAAVWGEQEDAYSAQAGPARIRLFQDGKIETLWESEALSDPPHLRAGRVAWLSYGVENALWLKQPKREVQTIAKGQIRYYTLTERAAWWLDDGRVMRYDFKSGDTREAHPGPCYVLVGDAERVATVCGTEPDESGYAIARLGTPVVLDDDGATELTTRGGATIAGLRVLGRRAAWVEYEAGSGCYTGIDDVGELVITDLAEPTEPQLVTRVTAGCWCCDAYWPALEVSFSERGLAWNYPRVESNNGTARDVLGAVGWALFGPCK